MVPKSLSLSAGCWQLGDQQAFVWPHPRSAFRSTPFERFSLRSCFQGQGLVLLAAELVGMKGFARL